MKVVATSDCHGRLARAELPPGDVLVLAGDILDNESGEPDEDAELQEKRLPELDAFLAILPYKHILLIAGNHDWVFEKRPGSQKKLPHATYLQDDSVEIEGVKFHGSPWQPLFLNWAFNLPRGGPELLERWKQIPSDTDVLITHGPPHGILDEVPWRKPPLHVGCELLRERVDVLRPKVHVFGHIHDSYGRLEQDGTLFLNVALCTDAMAPVQPPQVFEVG